MIIRDGTVATPNEANGMRNERGSAVNPGVLDPLTAGGKSAQTLFFISWSMSD